jgi:hypothetical protein
MYGLVIGHTARRVTMDIRPECDKKTLFKLAISYLLFPCFRIALVEIELMIGLFSVFEVMEPQGNYIEELYNQGENKLT